MTGLPKGDGEVALRVDGQGQNSACEELEADDFYMEGPYVVMTASFHRKRGYCCESGCRECPYR